MILSDPDFNLDYKLLIILSRSNVSHSGPNAQALAYCFLNSFFPYYETLDLNSNILSSCGNLKGATNAAKYLKCLSMLSCSRLNILYLPNCQYI